MTNDYLAATVFFLLAVLCVAADAARPGMWAMAIPCLLAALYVVRDMQTRMPLRIDKIRGLDIRPQQLYLPL